MLWREQVNFQWNDDDVPFVLDQHAELAHWNNSQRIDMSLHSDTLFWFRANQSVLSDRHVAPLGHIILIPNQPVFALSPDAACLAEKQHIPIL